MSTPTLIPFNFNDYVRVRLSDAGKIEMRRQHNKLRRKYPSLEKFRPMPVDEDGYTRWQLWELMSTFGATMSMGATPPFATEILFEVTAAGMSPK